MMHKSGKVKVTEVEKYLPGLLFPSSPLLVAYGASKLVSVFFLLCWFVDRWTSLHWPAKTEKNKECWLNQQHGSRTNSKTKWPLSPTIRSCLYNWSGKHLNQILRHRNESFHPSLKHLGPLESCNLTFHIVPLGTSRNTTYRRFWLQIHLEYVLYKSHANCNVRLIYGKICEWKFWNSSVEMKKHCILTY